MNNSPEEWPSYHIGTRDHLHAIGVLIAAWNEVENCYQAFIQQIFPSNIKSAVRTFQILNNDQRVKLIKDELITVLPEKEADCVEHFLTMANICYQNRNMFSHATSHSTPPAVCPPEPPRMLPSGPGRLCYRLARKGCRLPKPNWLVWSPLFTLFFASGIVTIFILLGWKGSLGFAAGAFITLTVRRLREHVLTWS
jgi:hypothetical protein